MLDELGFDWDIRTKKSHEYWMKWYHELENCIRENGNENIPRTNANIKLANWVRTQRIRRDNPYGKILPLTSDQLDLLEKLELRWDIWDEILSKSWKEVFRKMKGS